MFIKHPWSPLIDKTLFVFYNLNYVPGLFLFSSKKIKKKKLKIE